MVGAGVVALGYGLGTVLMSATWQLVGVSALIGAGIGLAYGAMPALVMAAVPVSHSAAGNSLNNLVRALGTSIASAVAGSVLVGMTVTVGPLTVPSQGAFRLVMGLGAAAAVVALAVAGFPPRPAADLDTAAAVAAADSQSFAPPTPVAGR